MKRFGLKLTTVACVAAIGSGAVLGALRADDRLAAVAPQANAPAATIVIKNFDFAPMNVTVKAGSTVAWKNEDGEPHTVTSEAGLFRSSGLDEGDAFSFKFDKPGTYKYVCSIHPKMVGTIVVK